jgi:hypothetical protein
MPGVTASRGDCARLIVTLTGEVKEHPNRSALVLRRAQDDTRVSPLDDEEK